MAKEPHSAVYFGESRDYWWNRDFLELMARRWRLAEVRSVLDVGCGQGHWARCLAPFLSHGCSIVGVDREAPWVEEARRRGAAFPDLHWTFQQAEAEHLPFADKTFDLVTCQTVLIHVRDAREVLREMVRVLRPGGLLAVVEPNNLSVNLTTADLEPDPAELFELLGFQMRCEQGKMRLGEGFNSLGPLLPGWLAEIGLDGIECFQSDKTVALLPDHADQEARTVIAESMALLDRGHWIWEKAEAGRYFVAGGGDAAMFESLWRRALARERSRIVALAERGLSFTSAPTCLLTSGRKIGD